MKISSLGACFLLLAVANKMVEAEKSIWNVAVVRRLRRRLGGGKCTPSPSPAPTPAPTPNPTTAPVATAALSWGGGGSDGGYNCDDYSSDDSDGGGGCFSGSTTVEVQHRGATPMEELKVGDKVLTGSNQYQQVYSFGHYHEKMEGEFFQIFTSLGNTNKKPLEMTGNHMIFVQDAVTGQQKAVPADQLKVGDIVIQGGSDGASTTVTKITQTKKPGVYMPLTPDGTIVVEGIKASTYVSIADEAPDSINTATSTFGFSDQSISHLWLSPYRLLCMGVSTSFCQSTNRDDGILGWLQTGRNLAKQAESLGFWTKSLIIGVPATIAFTASYLIESGLGGPAYAPLVLAIIGFVIYSMQTKSSNGKTLKKKAA